MSEMYLTTTDMAEEEESILSMRHFGKLQNCGEKGNRIFENIQMENAMLPPALSSGTAKFLLRVQGRL